MNVNNYDENMISLLKVNKLFFKKISNVSQDFYKVYIKKCNEYGTYMNFFEILYVYLIGYGFRQKKIKKYIEIVHDKIVNQLKSSVSDIPLYNDI